MLLRRFIRKMETFMQHLYDSDENRRRQKLIKLRLARISIQVANRFKCNFTTRDAALINYLVK